MNYIAGRGNLACTIFVPYDCDNKCPFCTSKHMYKHMNMDLNKILDHIDEINKVDAVSEFVITGGEPFANLEILDKIISRCQKTVYVNTTLPNSNKEAVINYINNSKISGISISRQFNFDFQNVMDIEDIQRIEKSIRINGVLPFDPVTADIEKDGYGDKVRNFIDKWGQWLVNLRADYRYVTIDTLKKRDNFDEWLLENYVYNYTNSCMVCNSEVFLKLEIGKPITNICYHRGIQMSSFMAGPDKMYIGDIIITPNGNMHTDWNLDEEENQEFINCIKTNNII